MMFYDVLCFPKQDGLKAMTNMTNAKRPQLTTRCFKKARGGAAWVQGGWSILLWGRPHG